MYYKINVIQKSYNHLLALSTQSNSLLQTDKPLSDKKLKINRPTKKGNIMTAKSQPNIVKPNFKNLEPDAVLYIGHLEKENLKLHSEIAKFQVTDFSKSNKIKTMEKEIVKLTKHTDNVMIVLPYKRGGPLPTHVQTTENEFIEIFYKHDN